MTILQIIPGSGGSFYCGNCLRDSKFFESLRKLNHDVIKIPMYLPLFSDEHDLTDIPVFYGAISIYLKQVFPIFRKAPEWFDNMLNAGPMLKFAASMAGSTRAEGNEDMTISMLLGEEGKQREELTRMIDWIAEHLKPDVVHLSNALLLGLAHEMKTKLNAKIICSLQDEDVWVDGMREKFRKETWALMSEKAKYVDLFVSVSDYYKDVSLDRMQIDPGKIKTIHLGVDPDEYSYVNSSHKGRNIGYISRMCHENGLDILVDAFIKLKKKPENEDVKLIITGGKTSDDNRYIKTQKGKLQRNNILHDVEFMYEFEGDARKEFLNQISMVSVPVRNGEAFGIYLTEAMAAGIPIVQPKLGAFPEIAETSGAGIIYENNNPEELADALQTLLNDKEKLHDMSKKARESTLNEFNINRLANDMIAVYEGIGK